MSNDFSFRDFRLEKHVLGCSKGQSVQRRHQQRVFSIQVQHRHSVSDDSSCHCRSLWTVDLGFYKKWMSLLKTVPQCLLHFNNKGVATERRNKPSLELAQFYGAFLLLLLGCLLATLVFLCELIIYRLARTDKVAHN